MRFFCFNQFERTVCFSIFAAYTQMPRYNLISERQNEPEKKVHEGERMIRRWLDDPSHNFDFYYRVKYFSVRFLICARFVST